MLELFATDWRSLWQGAEAHEPVGAVFTKPEIVELILDLAGYTASDRRLSTCSLLEPSCGDGAFLSAVLARLLTSERSHAGEIDWDNVGLDRAIRAADINGPSVKAARGLVAALLKEAGCPQARASELASTWIVQTDFLLHDWGQRFDFVIGNPPYVRIENVPKPLLGRYRELFQTTTNRADLYVAFFERGLELLSPAGVLAFICANRFTKNRYGEALRSLIARQYHVRTYLNLEHTQPFVTDVSAYPAIIVIDRHRGEPTLAGSLDDLEPDTLCAVRSECGSGRAPARMLSEFASWYPQGGPWITTQDREHELLARLSASLPRLEDSAPGTRVGIGVATGRDRVFILKHREPEIEDSRQIPVLMASDVSNAGLSWSGHYLVNPFSDEDDGSLVDLGRYPGLASYLDRHAEKLKGRHVARSRPQAWYRTIDRIWPRLQHTPKLMIPDIQGAAVIGYDKGRYYPHHNLYWITSESWPLLALKALLRSRIALQQVRAYSVQMRGGSMRFQAQTLRRLRVPHLCDVPSVLLDRLASLSGTDSQIDIDEAAAQAYEMAALARS